MFLLNIYSSTIVYTNTKVLSPFLYLDRFWYMEPGPEAGREGEDGGAGLGRVLVPGWRLLRNGVRKRRGLDSPPHGRGDGALPARRGGAMPPLHAGGGVPIEQLHRPIYCCGELGPDY